MPRCVCLAPGDVRAVLRWGARQHGRVWDVSRGGIPTCRCREEGGVGHVPACAQSDGCQWHHARRVQEFACSSGSECGGVVVACGGDAPPPPTPPHLPATAPEASNEHSMPFAPAALSPHSEPATSSTISFASCPSSCPGAPSTRSVPPRAAATSACASGVGSARGRGGEATHAWRWPTPPKVRLNT